MQSKEHTMPAIEAPHPGNRFEMYSPNEADREKFIFTPSWSLKRLAQQKGFGDIASRHSGRTFKVVHHDFIQPSMPFLFKTAFWSAFILRCQFHQPGWINRLPAYTHFRVQLLRSRSPSCRLAASPPYHEPGSPLDKFPGALKCVPTSLKPGRACSCQPTFIVQMLNIDDAAFP